MTDWLKLKTLYKSCTVCNRDTDCLFYVIQNFTTDTANSSVVTVYDLTIQWVQQCLISVHHVLPHKYKNIFWGLHFSLQCWFSLAVHWTPDTLVIIFTCNANFPLAADLTLDILFLFSLATPIFHWQLIELRSFFNLQHQFSLAVDWTPGFFNLRHRFSLAADWIGSNEDTGLLVFSHTDLPT